MFDKKGALAHDDRVDALSSAVAYWESSLSVDVDRVIAKRHLEEKDKVVKDWVSDDRRMGLFSDRLQNAMIKKRTPITNKWAKSKCWTNKRR